MELQMPHVDTEKAGETRYKIGDVCRIADVQPYVLRYWESEFAGLAADRTHSGPRTYSARELKIIEQIKRLLYDEGYTIAGAKKRLETEALAASRAEVVAAAPEKPERGKRPASKSDTAPVHPVRIEKTQPVLLEPPKTAETPAPDPRLSQAVAELKDILKLLS